MGILTNGQRKFLLTIARRIVPESSALTPGEQAQFLDLVEDGLSLRTRSTQRQFTLFLSVVRWAPVLRHGRRLDRLDESRQDGVLRFLQDAPLQIVRSGFWGLRTLILLGYYGRPEVGPSIGYRPTRRGNDLLHGR